MMPTPVTLETFTPDQWALYRELRLRALRDSPDAFGSTHALEAARPDALWQSRLAAAAASGADLPLLARAGDVPAGLCWAKRDAAEPAVVHLFQMWVEPACRRCGIGQSLLDRSIQWSRRIGAAELRLGVTVADTAAYRLYVRNGFVPRGQPEPLREDSDLLAQNLSLALAGEA